MGLSTHVLDTAIGRPAVGVGLVLSRIEADNATPMEIGRGITDADGRCKTLLGDQSLEAATYTLRFATAAYYASTNNVGLYPYVEIAFTIRDPAQHYHIPLLLTANGYSTYRGS